jgi:hypothetical protein
VNDDLLDSGETIQVHLANATIVEGNVGITTPLATATISDLDQSLNFSVSVDDEGAESAGTAVGISEEKQPPTTPRPSR